MRKAITLALLIVALSATAQRYNWKRPQLWAGVGMGFTSGLAWGVHEKIMFHYPIFQKRFPNANPQFWNPQVSWLNKYKNNDPEQGRNGKPVVFTDAKHLLASTHQVAIFSAGIIVVIGEKRKWWEYALDIAAVSLARSAGNYIGFNGLYK